MTEIKSFVSKDLQIAMHVASYSGYVYSYIQVASIYIASYIQLLLLIVCNISTEYSDCSTATVTIQAQYHRLIYLPVDSLLQDFFANNVITFDQREHIKKLPHEMERMEFILDVIISNLDAGVGKLYNGFLKVMKESDLVYTTELAKKLGKLAKLYICIMYTMSCSSSSRCSQLAMRHHNWYSKMICMYTVTSYVTDPQDPSSS